MNLWDALGLIGVLIGILLSVNTGRNLARRRHDALLFRESIKIPLFNTMFYIMFIFLLIWNTFFICMMSTFTFSIKFIISMFNLTNLLYSLVITGSEIIISFYVFSMRYRGLNKPLTREGKIMYYMMRKARIIGSSDEEKSKK